MRHDRKEIVRILTPRDRSRRKIDELRACRSLLPMSFVLLLLLMSNSGLAGSPNWQPTAEIRTAAESYLRAKIGASPGRAGSRTAIQAGVLDARHRLPLCDKALEGFMRRGAKIGSRTVVGVRCTGNKPWKVYLPVDLIVTASVVVAPRTLPRGHLLAATDLAVDQRDVSRMITGYYTDPKELAGQRLKSRLIAGNVITPSMLQADNVVRRGQTVTLMVNNAEINIRMSGTALMDGAVNQRIRVENTNSGRIVEGIVRTREHVEIIVPYGDAFFNAKAKVSAVQADTKPSNNDR